MRAHFCDTSFGYTPHKAACGMPDVPLKSLISPENFGKLGPEYTRCVDCERKYAEYTLWLCTCGVCGVAFKTPDLRGEHQKEHVLQPLDDRTMPDTFLVNCEHARSSGKALTLTAARIELAKFRRMRDYEIVPDTSSPGIYLIVPK